MFKRILVAAAAVSMMAAASPTVAANLIVNGTFEDGATGWSGIDGSTNVLRTGADYAVCCGVSGADLTNHLVSFELYDPLTPLSQTVETQAGVWYDFLFDLGTFGDASYYSRAVNVYAYDDETGEVITGGSALGSAAGSSVASFLRTGLTFRAESSHTRFDLWLPETPDTSNPSNGLVDNFTLTERFSTGGSVPEPGTWALMISGFGLAGMSLRRRRAAIAA
jgi:hypothetical protein